MEKGNCFVCGAHNHVGLRLDFEIDREKQQAVCATRITEDYQGWSGIVHGGIIASILDGSMVYACKSIGLSCRTAELNVRYKKEIPLNTPVCIRATVRNHVKWLSWHVVHTDAVIEMDGKVAARAKGKMFVNKKQEEA